MPRKFKKEKDTKKEKKRLVMKKRACRFCIDKELVIDYKLARQLGQFLSETAKIVPRRVTGNCAYHQRRVGEAIRRARTLAFIPYTMSHVPTA